ncbi:MAG: hypothetical protein Solumvirus6_11 [Solumvirus sp.]|uniref:Uncharacterized protein n=1 Tax=Solumvirus sp. TaxID=2487773 RepID=A0A3G5AGM2_9VIRU|nr:MAG: hypothetical protein Solumvirus6_11 [Solumvirus sp.]
MATASAATTTSPTTTPPTTTPSTTTPSTTTPIPETTNKVEDSSIEQVIEEYKCLSLIEAKHTYNVSSKSAVIKNAWSTAISRWWYGESHLSLLTYLEGLIERSGKVIENIKNDTLGASSQVKKDDKSDKKDDKSDKKDDIIKYNKDDLKNAMSGSLMGLNNLKENYETLPVFQERMLKVIIGIGNLIHKCQ